MKNSNVIPIEGEQKNDSHVLSSEFSKKFTPIMPPYGDNLSDQDIVNLFMGLVRLVRRQYQSQIDALKKQIEELTSKREPQSTPQPV